MPKDIMKMNFDELLLDYKEELREYKLKRLILNAYEEHLSIKQLKHCNWMSWLEHYAKGGEEKEYTEEEVDAYDMALCQDIVREEREIEKKERELMELRRELWRKYNRLLELRRQKKGKKKSSTKKGKKSSTKKGKNALI